MNNSTKYDIIVAGGGPAGVAAAIAAGRKGARVLLIEQQNCLGGMWTSGFVNPLFDMEDKGGLLKEIIDELRAKNAWGGFWGKSFIYEYMKALLEEKCIAAGVQLLYDTRYVGVSSYSGEVTSIYTENIEGRLEYSAKVFIDATPDASLAVDAGTEWLIGDGDVRACQAMTLMFLIGGIHEKYRDGKMIYEQLKAAYLLEGKGRSPVFKVPYLIPAPNSDFAVVQLTHMRGYDCLSAQERTLAVIEGRKQAIEAFEILKNFDDDFKDISLITTAPLLGIRESRRILGEYCLTEEDLAEGAKFPDAVCFAGFGIDIHNSKSSEQTVRHVKRYEIPFRCLMPKGVKNVIVAGKTISGTHTAMASYRVTGNCCAMGEAAGKAAAYAVKNNVPIRQVPADEYHY